VTRKHSAGCELMPARAVLRWPRHPRTIGAADKSANRHDSTVGLGARQAGRVVVAQRLAVLFHGGQCLKSRGLGIACVGKTAA
jgi:hypothetical protein